MINANIVIRNDTEIEARGKADSMVHQLVFRDAAGSEIAALLPAFTADDITAALAVCDRLEAVVDNLVSGLRLREQAEERERARASYGNGAGASVEADRG